MVNAEQPKRKVAFVPIDGLGDVSLPRFGYKTPLELATLPNLIAIASAVVNGLMDPVGAGLGCGSDTAHLYLLGYDPRVYITGVEVHLSQRVLDWRCYLVILHSKYATEHRCGVVVKDPRLSGNISGTDPLKDNRMIRMKQNTRLLLSMNCQRNITNSSYSSRECKTGSGGEEYCESLSSTQLWY